jgi:RNA-directed DNA polymerase
MLSPGIDLFNNNRFTAGACLTSAPTNTPATFLGFVLLPDGRRRLPPDNVKRFRQRLTSLRHRWAAGTVDRVKVEQRVRAWIAHAEHAQTWRLRQTLFGDGIFSPVPERDPSDTTSAFFGAVPGTTIRGTSGPPIATGTTPTTTTTTSGSVSPVRGSA